MMDHNRNDIRCRALSITCKYPLSHHDGATGPDLMVHGALTRILRLFVFASSLAVFAVGMFLYVQYLRRFAR
jgi:hypothetical protein